MRPAVRLFPERLRPRPAKQLFGSAHGELLQSFGGGPSEWLRARRQGLLQLALHVAIRIDPIRQEDRDLALNRLILEQVAARLGPVLGVKQLPICPKREDRQQRQQRGECDQDEWQAPPPHRGLDRGSRIGR